MMTVSTGPQHFSCHVCVQPPSSVATRLVWQPICKSYTSGLPFAVLAWQCACFRVLERSLRFSCPFTLIFATRLENLVPT